jgi:hypothetical protein
MSPVLERITRPRRGAAGQEGAQFLDASRYLPWLLDGASPQRTALVLGRLPEQLGSLIWMSGYRPIPGGICGRPADDAGTAAE